MGLAMLDIAGGDAHVVSEGSGEVGVKPIEEGVLP